MTGLGIDWYTLLAQLVNFFILFGVLGVVLYKPILKMFDERSRKIKESMEQADLTRQQVAQAEEEVARQLDEARKQGLDVLAQATKASEDLRQKLQQDAKQEAEALVNRARKEIQRERDEAVGVLRQEFADITIKAAEKVIERSLDKQAHTDIINKVLEENAPPVNN